MAPGGSKILKEFKEFAIKGNAIDLAVGVVIGAAFGAIVNSLVNDLIMPIVSLITGRVNFANLYIVLGEGSKAPGPYATLQAAKDAGASVIAYGNFIQSIVTFLIIAASVFVMVRAINRLRKPAAEEVTTRDCPFCLTTVPKAASKCSACGSAIEPVK